jgi:hypothetical protein
MTTTAREKKKKIIRTDLLWKELLESFLYPALEIFYPSLYAAVDLDKEPVFLNKELRIPGTRRGQKIVDLLADIPMKAGGFTCLLLHVELQGEIRGEPFHVRMFKYSCLIVLRLERPFTALAIRTTPRGKSEELRYEAECFETRNLYTYPTVFIDQMDEARLLVMEHNPLALAVAAAACMIRAGKSETRRFEYGREMLRILKSRGYSQEVYTSLIHFIEGVTRLSAKKLLDDFEKEVDIFFMEVESMSVTTPIVDKVLKKRSYEWGRAQGKAEGKAEGLHLKAVETARLMLERGMAVDLIADLTKLSEDEVRELANTES